MQYNYNATYTIMIPQRMKLVKRFFKKVALSVKDISIRRLAMSEIFIYNE